MKTLYKRLLVLGAIALVIGILIHRFGIPNYFTLAYIKQRTAHFEAAMQENYLSAVLVYLLSCAAAVTAGLPIIGLFAMVAGFLFGVWEGLFYTIIASTFGSVVFVVLARYLLANLLEGRYHAQLERFNKRIAQYGYSYLVALHLSTIAPFFLINSLAALAGVPLYAVAWTTAVGAIPSLFLYSFAGRKLLALTSARDIFTPDIVILLLILAFLAFLPTIVRYVQKQVEKREQR